MKCETEEREKEIVQQVEGFFSTFHEINREIKLKRGALAVLFILLNSWILQGL